MADVDRQEWETATHRMEIGAIAAAVLEAADPLAVSGDKRLDQPEREEIVPVSDGRL